MIARNKPFALSIGVALVHLLIFVEARAIEVGRIGPVTAGRWRHLTTVSEDGIPAPGPSNQQTASLVADLDGDKINDFVIASRKEGPSVIWYRREKTGWTKFVVDNSTLPIEAGGAVFDIDRDGDPDILFGADWSDNKIWWWENPCPNFAPNIPWTRRHVKISGAKKHHDQAFGDVDGDGQTELVFWNQGARKLYVAKIPSRPRSIDPWPCREIFSWTSGDCEGLTVADIDGDGELDIVGGGRWFEHLKNGSYAAHVVDVAQSSSRVAVGQLKKGGRPEIVFVAGDAPGPLRWYEWDGGRWVGRDLLERDAVHGHSLGIADLDGDGNLDVFCAEMRQWSEAFDDNPQAKMWIFAGDGNGNFRQIEIASGIGNHESKVADLDGDGDLDVLGKPYTWQAPRLDIWLNETTDNRFGKLSLDTWWRWVIDADRPWRAVFIDAYDMNGDGRSDIVTGAWWYRNPGSADGPWERNTIGEPLNNMAAVSDFDGDGDQDVLGTQGRGSDPNARFVWARNDGTGDFQVLGNIAEAEGDFLQGACVAVFENLSPVEVVLSWHQSGHGVQMLTVPAAPEHDQWTWRRLTRLSQDEQLSVGDIDRDGTLDLLLGTSWLCNGCPQSPSRLRALDGRLGTEWLRWRVQSVAEVSESPDRNRLADVNGDGLLDAVVGFEAIGVAGALVWFEQPRRGNAQWVRHPVATLVGPMSLDAADMDADGDIDLIVGEHNPADPAKAGLYIFENSGGKGTTWLRHSVFVGDEHHDGAVTVDMDGDGDRDIVSIGWSHSRVHLYENLAISR